MLQNRELPAVIAQWLGPEAAGNWALVVLVLIMFFFNTFGEELYWRGIIFPRQELVHGRWTWLVHGLMWNLFHLPIYPWYIVAGLPVTLTISWVAQKTGNTWTAIILHALGNVFMYSLIISVVARGV
jgi:membrane protease YdiL (CAAX protease family)